MRECGIRSQWFEERYDLSAYQAGDSLRLRFGFKSDDDGAVGEGFYLDDIRVWSAIAGSRESLPAAIPAQLALLPNFPNPFQRMTSIVYQLPYPARVELAVYAIDGRRVRTLEQSSKPAGYYMRSWSGLDDKDRPLPAGVYVCRLEVERDGLRARFQRQLAFVP